MPTHSPHEQIVGIDQRHSYAASPHRCFEFEKTIMFRLTPIM